MCSKEDSKECLFFSYAAAGVNRQIIPYCIRFKIMEMRSPFQKTEMRPAEKKFRPRYRQRLHKIICSKTAYFFQII